METFRLREPAGLSSRRTPTQQVRVLLREEEERKEEEEEEELGCPSR